MEAVRHSSSVRSLVYVTSDKCYENLEWVWAIERPTAWADTTLTVRRKVRRSSSLNPIGGHFFQERTDLGEASARAGNVIGGGDFAEDRIVPDAMRALSKGESIGVRNPVATRPWQHVLEPLSGYLSLVNYW